MITDHVPGGQHYLNTYNQLQSHFSNLYELCNCNNIYISHIWYQGEANCDPESQLNNIKIINNYNLNLNTLLETWDYTFSTETSIILNEIHVKGKFKQNSKESINQILKKHSLNNDSALYHPTPLKYISSDSTHLTTEGSKLKFNEILNEIINRRHYTRIKRMKAITKSASHSWKKYSTGNWITSLDFLYRKGATSELCEDFIWTWEFDDDKNYILKGNTCDSEWEEGNGTNDSKELLEFLKGTPLKNRKIRFDKYNWAKKLGYINQSSDHEDKSQNIKTTLEIENTNTFPLKYAVVPDSSYINTELAFFHNDLIKNRIIRSSNHQDQFINVYKTDSEIEDKNSNLLENSFIRSVPNSYDANEKSYTELNPKNTVTSKRYNKNLVIPERWYNINLYANDETFVTGYWRLHNKDPEKSLANTVHCQTRFDDHKSHNQSLDRLRIFLEISLKKRLQSSEAIQIQYTLRNPLGEYVLNAKTRLDTQLSNYRIDISKNQNLDAIFLQFPGLWDISFTASIPHEKFPLEIKHSDTFAIANWY